MGIMAKYRESLHLLLRSKGVEDVMSTDFKEIDEDTPVSKFSFKYVMGNIRLIMGKIRTPMDVNQEVEAFLNEPS